MARFKFAMIAKVGDSGERAMSDESEIVRLETTLQCAAMTAFRVSKLSAQVVQYPSGSHWGAAIALSGKNIDGEGATPLEALRDLRDTLREKLARRRDAQIAAIAMLGIEES